MGIKVIHDSPQTVTQDQKSFLSGWKGRAISVLSSAIVGGVIGGFAGSLFGPLGILAGAVVGAALGVIMVAFKKIISIISSAVVGGMIGGIAGTLIGPLGTLAGAVGGAALGAIVGTFGVLSTASAIGGFVGFGVGSLGTLAKTVGGAALSVILWSFNRFKVDAPDNQLIEDSKAEADSQHAAALKEAIGILNTAADECRHLTSEELPIVRATIDSDKNSSEDLKVAWFRYVPAADKSFFETFENMEISAFGAD